MKQLVTIATAAMLLGACGNIGPLSPAPGQPLPVRPLMATATPTPKDLLIRPAYANPDRVDELMRRSVPRVSDRFDLPPPSGAAPDIPVEAVAQDDEEVNAKGPVKEQ